MFNSAKERSAVLLLEEDNQTCLSLLKLLQGQGYNVETTANLTEALKQLASGLFPIFICGVEAENFAEFEFLKKIEDQELEIQVILVSTVVTVELALNAIKQGAFDLLSKPVSSDHLTLTLARLEEHLRVVNERHV